MTAKTRKPIPGGAVCGDSLVAGVLNYQTRGGVYGDREACAELATHTLRGKPLCRTHWLEGLEAAKRTEASMRGYSNQLRNYNRG